MKSGEVGGKVHGDDSVGADQGIMKENVRISSGSRAHLKNPCPISAFLSAMRSRVVLTDCRLKRRVRHQARQPARRRSAFASAASPDLHQKRFGRKLARAVANERIVGLLVPYDGTGCGSQGRALDAGTDDLRRSRCIGRCGLGYSLLMGRDDNATLAGLKRGPPAGAR